MKTLHVDLGDRSYPIHIGQDLLAQPKLLREHIYSEQVMIVSNETVAPLYLEAVLASLSDLQVHSVILPDGEQYKTLDIVNRIFTSLLENRFDRQCTLIALGGGVVGDMTGFAAACYQRGVNFIQIPTTLLAQVDSSVGGKTGVNHPMGKNMIGAFYQPQCVLIDTNTLNTLDDRQLSAGLAEVIKYGLIRDPDFFDWLEANMAQLLARDPNAIIEAIERSCENKADVVAADEFEAGQRALLNLGHTFGHAIETGTGYGTWLHGEAVSAGTVMAADLSLKMNWITQQDFDRTLAILKAAKLPTEKPNSMDKAQFLDLMSVDKKAQAGKLRFILMKSIGHAVLTSEFDSSLLEECLS